MLFLIADGKVVYASPSGVETLGVSLDDASSRWFEVFQLVALAPEYLDVSQESLGRRSRGEQVAPTACALLTRDGRRIEGILRSELIECSGRREPVGIFTDKKVHG